MSTNTFYDLPAEERGYWYDRARDETGQDFHDLPAEERGYWYDRATNEAGPGGFWGVFA